MSDSRRPKPDARRGCGKSTASDTCWQVDRSERGTSLSAHIAGKLLTTEEDASDLIDFGSVQVNGRQERNPSRALEGSEEIHVHWPWHGTRRHYEIAPGRVLYRDKYLLAYDKEAGIPSQQTPSDGYNNLYAALYRYLRRENVPNPYLALHHRLDQETSGVMLFALDRSANRKIGSAFEQRSVVKDYLAWVSGKPSFETHLATEDIGRLGGRYTTCPKGKGKPAETLLTVLVPGANSSLIWARPHTGRTHQIRLHLSAAGHPVLGDRLYGGKPARRLYLHAYRLKLKHPITGADLTLIAPLPGDWPPPLSAAIPD